MPKLKIYDISSSTCFRRKQFRLSFPRKNKCNESLELIRTDLCDPMIIKSLDGCIHFAMFIDDYSRKFLV